MHLMFCCLNKLNVRYLYYGRKTGNISIHLSLICTKLHQEVNQAKYLIGHVTLLKLCERINEIYNSMQWRRQIT